MLLLQEYDFEIIHKPGRHVIGDHLSRITTGKVAQGVPNSFLNASLLMVQATTDKDILEVLIFTDLKKPIINYLQTGQISAYIPLNCSSANCNIMHTLPFG